MYINYKTTQLFPATQKLNQQKIHDYIFHMPHAFASYKTDSKVYFYIAVGHLDTIFQKLLKCHSSSFIIMHDYNDGDGLHLKMMP